MYKEKVTTVLLAGLLFASGAYAAGPKLIAIGAVSGFYEDFAIETATPLENGVPGNRLGGLGSGLAYAGGNVFLAVPDRGPNAKAYNSLVDDTVSYINRFQTFSLSLAPSDPGSALPFTLTPMLICISLPSSKEWPLDRTLSSAVRSNTRCTSPTITTFSVQSRIQPIPSTRPLRTRTSSLCSYSTIMTYPVLFLSRSSFLARTTGMTKKEIVHNAFGGQRC
jgi:hypothetical protein